MRTLKILLAAASVLLVANTASAIKLSGAITFSGGVTLNSGSAGTATAVTGWDAEVESVSGNFSPPVSVGDAVTLVAPWSFNSGAINNFWSVSGFTFDLLNSSVDFQNSSAVVVSGKGWISGNGFESTAGVWNFSTQNPKANGVFSFSASTEVPDAGATSILLGLGLISLVAVRRFKK